MAVFPNLVLSLTTPLQPVLSVLAPTYLTKPSALPHPHSHYHSCTFMVSLLYLVGQTSIWPFLPHLQPSPDPRSDVVTPLLEKVQMKAFKNNLTCFCLYSLVSCFSFHPIRAWLSLSSYLQFCAHHPLSPLCLQLLEHTVLITGVSHNLPITSLLPGSYSPFKILLLQECFPNLPSSPGLIQTSLFSDPHTFCLYFVLEHLSYLYYNHLRAVFSQPPLTYKACGNSE